MNEKQFLKLIDLNYVIVHELYVGDSKVFSQLCKIILTHFAVTKKIFRNIFFLYTPANFIVSSNTYYVEAVELCSEYLINICYRNCDGSAFKSSTPRRIGELGRDSLVGMKGLGSIVVTYLHGNRRGKRCGPNCSNESGL